MKVKRLISIGLLILLLVQTNMLPSLFFIQKQIAKIHFNQLSFSQKHRQTESFIFSIQEFNQIKKDEAHEFFWNNHEYDILNKKILHGKVKITAYRDTWESSINKKIKHFSHWFQELFAGKKGVLKLLKMMFKSLYHTVDFHFVISKSLTFNSIKYHFNYHKQVLFKSYALVCPPPEFLN